MLPTTAERSGTALEDRAQDSSASTTTANRPAIRSVLRKAPPPSIARLLREQAIDPDDLVLCTDTDIDHLGRYQSQWLAVTEERLLVLSEGPKPAVLHSLRREDVTEIRCQSAIGSGLLQARVDELYVDLLRYSNRQADRFGKLARKIERALHGEEIEFHAEDESDSRRCSKCGLMLDVPGEVCPRCVEKGAVLTRMWRLMTPYRRSAIVMMGLMVVGILLDLVGPQLTRYMVDHVLAVEAVKEAQVQPVKMHQHLMMLVVLVGILAAVQTTRMLIYIINGRLTTRVGTAITFDMRSRLVDHLQKLSVSYYDRQQVGSLVGRVAYDTEALQGFVAQLTGGFLLQIVMLILVAIAIFSLNVKLALFMLVPAPLVAAGSVVFWRYIYPRYYRFWDASSKQAGMLSGLLSGIRVVKAFSQESREMARFNATSGRLQETRRNVDMSMSTFHPIMGLVFQLGGWIVWFVGGRDVLQGQMTLGELMAFFGYLWMFYSPLGSLTQFTNWLTTFVTQAHRMFEILDAPVQIADAKEPVALNPMQGQITFEKVTFGYNRHSPVLRDIDLHIQPGEMIGVVGRSGSGKTTVINLLCRFYDVDEGRVLIDGVDVRQVSKENLRSQIGVVLQEPFLFRGSIWENVTYGRPDAAVEEVLKASKAANCHDFIMRRPHGYDTWVGEQGAGLSGGEKQRTSIARVLLTDPRILILDEATSSVDAESEAAIQAALAEVVKGRTTIAIAHRLSTLRNATRILVVDRGKIVESGRHDELVAKDGLYARLVKMQGQMAMPPSVDRLAKEAEEQAAVPAAAAAVAADPKQAAPANPTELPLGDIKGFHPRWLTPGNARIHLGNHNALHVTVLNERIYGGVFALRCLPVRYPSQYISLRYLDHEKRETEVGLIRNLADWPAEAQQLIRESLLKRYFVHTIRGIRGIENFQGYLNFDVETDLGPMQFMMRWQGDRAQDYGSGGKMLLDTEDNRYLIPEVQQLPERERATFQRFIYW